MGLYNVLHGTNPDSALLLAFLEIPDKYPMPPRFRDISYRNKKIILYCRQGGGNRECVQEWSHSIKEYKAEGYEIKDHPEHRYYSTYCYCTDCNYNPDIKSKDDCKQFCNGDSDYQRYNKQVAEHPYHISDTDDDFDSTYNTHTFDLLAHPDRMALEKLIDLQNQPDFKENMNEETMKRMADEIATDYAAGREIDSSIKGVIDHLTGDIKKE